MSDYLQLVNHYLSYFRSTDPRLQPYFALKNIFCLTEKPIGPELYGPELAETVRDTLQKLMPLYQYCQTFAY